MDDFVEPFEYGHVIVPSADKRSYLNKRINEHKAAQALSERSLGRDIVMVVRHYLHDSQIGKVALVTCHGNTMILVMAPDAHEASMDKPFEITGRPELN